MQYIDFINIYSTCYELMVVHWFIQLLIWLIIILFITLY